MSHSPSSDLPSFAIFFAEGVARAVHVQAEAPPEAVLKALALPAEQCVLVVMGGAGNMEGDIPGLTELIQDGLARFAHERNFVIVTGGTASGVMAQIGAARAHIHGRFPLIGVAPDALVSYPGHLEPRQAALDPHHTHFVLTDGDSFGAESDWLAQVALAIAGETGRALAVIINGGEIVRQEAHARAVGPLFMPLLVLEGSGRTADALAEARLHPGTDPLLDEIVRKADLHVFPVEAGADTFYAWLSVYFSEWGSAAEGDD